MDPTGLTLGDLIHVFSDASGVTVLAVFMFLILRGELVTKASLAAERERAEIWRDQAHEWKDLALQLLDVAGTTVTLAETHREDGA